MLPPTETSPYLYATGNTDGWKIRTKNQRGRACFIYTPDPLSNWKTWEWSQDFLQETCVSPHYKIGQLICPHNCLAEMSSYLLTPKIFNHVHQWSPLPLRPPSQNLANRSGESGGQLQHADSLNLFIHSYPKHQFLFSLVFLCNFIYVI